MTKSEQIAGKLVDSLQNFTSTVSVGDAVKNTTDGTWTTVTAIDSDGQLSLNTDIMESVEDYEIYSSDAAKAKAKLIDVYGWDIIDGGKAA